MTQLQYACIKDGAIIERRYFDDPPPDVSRKGLTWLPVEIVIDPIGAGQVYDPMITTIAVDKVTIRQPARDMTANEISAAKDSQLNAIDKLVFEETFQLRNAIRALQSLAPLTAAQYKALIKARL